MVQPNRPTPRPSPRPTNVDQAFGGKTPQTPAQRQAPTDTRSLFRRAQQKISSTRDDGSSKWVNAERKQAWLDNLTPLFIHKLVYHATGRFEKPKWVLHISENDPSAPVWFASFTGNDYRDILFPELQAAIESSGQPLGPLMLTVHQMDGQLNPSWDLQPWDDGSGIPF